jgi:2-polyprenyl-3-methyl-5-hydroxy-6-metoxy-1,4-benzoquinol methylase
MQPADHQASTTQLTCWCGNRALDYYSPHYVRCPVCETLVWVDKGKNQPASLDYSEEGYYGSRYWFEHQTEELGFEDILHRSRSDLSGRCLYWLKTLLKHRLPQATALELGSSHGGFVAMLAKSGYSASGLEISPQIVDYARQSFQVPMLAGPLEEQKIPAGSLDLLVLMDVLEHLPDPVGTLHHGLSLLKPDGLLVIQTPCFDPKLTFQELNAGGHPFARMLIPMEHIHLFSEQGITRLLHQLEVPYLVFEPAYFAVHDMFVFASRVPIPTLPPETIEAHLLSTPDGRLILAMLDLYDQLESANADRAARLEIINEQDTQINEQSKQISEFDNKYREIRRQNDALLGQIDDLTHMVNDLGSVIQKQDRVLKWLPHNILRRLIRSLSSQKVDKP